MLFMGVKSSSQYCSSSRKVGLPHKVLGLGYSWAVMAHGLDVAHGAA